MLFLRLTLELQILAFALAWVVEAGSFGSASVRSLTGTNFHKEIDHSEKVNVVAFFAPWCGHCKKLAPEYDKAAKNLKHLVNFAAVDCDDNSNRGLCAEYDIKGFPTVKVFPGKPKSSPRDYNGPRTAKALADYAVDLMPHKVNKLKTSEEVAALLEASSDKPLVILLTTSANVTPLYKALSIDFYKSFDFYAVKQSDKLSDVAEKLGLQSVPGLVVKSPSGEKTVYTGKFNHPAIAAFLKKIPETEKAGNGKDEL